MGAVAVVSLARVWSRLSVLVVVETLQLLALPTGTFAVATTTASAALFFPCPFCLPLTPCACSPRLYKNQFTPVPHQDNLLVFFFSSFFFLFFFPFACFHAYWTCCVVCCCCCCCCCFFVAYFRCPSFPICVVSRSFSLFFFS